jgi:hypothetical protein
MPRSLGGWGIIFALIPRLGVAIRRHLGASFVRGAPGSKAFDGPAHLDYTHSRLVLCGQLIEHCED